ncbi:alpha/beta hydrolase [Stutzerimonas nosocomialis]|uniref:alpha/beta fold hydrolase n=1 Tax=Stutzerimonas nosocomialis TaxID=1056496 RepID=UPI00110836FF|nr:alpha/beta fold hydrolase [Stutzerimonas nosocomialis]TLX53056.1 alpha/beta hydrolase [Stutzerimonas nosocomialis]
MNAPFEEIRMSLSGVDLAAHQYGPDDGRPVIALHGWLDNAATFSRLAPRLEGLRIVALDLPGHGHSGHRPPGVNYAIWDYALDVLRAAEQLGWEHFSLLGHSMGAIVSVLLAGALPERIERLALIDGVIPYTGEADSAPGRLGEALLAQLAVDAKRKPVYACFEDAVQARMKGVGAVSHEAAQALVQRGLMPVPGGFTWRTDPRLMLPSAMRLTRAHAQAFVDRIACPVSLVLAEQGLLTQPAQRAFVEQLPFQMHRIAGGHHLHLDDDAGADAVAERFNAFFAG